MLQGRVGLDARAARSLQNSAMHLRKVGYLHSVPLVYMQTLLCTCIWSKHREADPS